jgi:uncharacterized protein YdaU (DUF1376 family)
LNKPPAYQYYPADFDSDTAAWSNEEVGAYQRLLNHAWLNRGLPNDTWRLATIVRTSIEYFEGHLWPMLSQKWVENGHGNLINPRQERERQKQEEYRLQQSEAGKRGVVAKKQKGAFPFGTGAISDDQEVEQDDQATLNPIIKQPLSEETSEPSEKEQGSVVEKSSSSFSSSSLKTTTREEVRQSGPLGRLIDSDVEFKKVFYEARKYFPRVGDWFGKSFKKYGEQAIRENKEELLLTLRAIAEKKQFDGNPWGYATNAFLGIVKDKILREQGDEKRIRAVHIKDLYKDFKGKADSGREAPRDTS